MSTQSSNVTANLTQEQQSMVARIVDKLAGEQGNLEVIVQDLTFNLGGSKHTLNGKINFNVFHEQEGPQKPLVE
jgi:hypothetical protein